MAVMNNNCSGTICRECTFQMTLACDWSSTQPFDDSWVCLACNAFIPPKKCFACSLIIFLKSQGPVFLLCLGIAFPHMATFFSLWGQSCARAKVQYILMNLSSLLYRNRHCALNLSYFFTKLNKTPKQSQNKTRPMI